MNSSRKRSRRSGAQQLEEVPDLIHLIQSRLPPKDAARTSVLSKSWLQTWSTIPALRFCHGRMKLVDIDYGDTKLDDIDRTLTRYLRDNIPIETFELSIEIENQESASLVENWLRLLATKTRVRELSLRILISCGASFNLNLPVEILAIESLTKLSVVSGSRKTRSVWMTTTSSHDPVIDIKCVSLREVQLDGVRISQGILDGILSSCSSLEKIELSHCSHDDLNTIKVRNLPCLSKLSILTDNQGPTDFVISHLPNLRFFGLDPHGWPFGHPNRRPFNALSISLGNRVTELTLGRIIIDYACLDKIKSGFPVLESLTLGMTSWMLGTFHFASASIKRLSLRFCPTTLTEVQVHAPKLYFFEFGGKALPSTLLFPISTLNQTVLSLDIKILVGASFFLKMRELLALSSCKWDLHITTHMSYSNQSLGIDIDDLRRKLIRFPPAMNVQQLSFQTIHDDGMWDRSQFFDALFEICHPEYVYARPDVSFKHNNHFCRLMMKEVLEKKNTGTVYWPHCLKHAQIREGRHQQWETLTNSHRSFLDGSAPDVHMAFKLKWC